MFVWSRNGTTLLPLGELFLPSIFNSMEFRSSMSCIVLDIELAD